MMDRDSALRGSRRSPSLLKFAVAFAGLCVVAGCGGASTGQAAASPGSAARTPVRAAAKAGGAAGTASASPTASAGSGTGTTAAGSGSECAAVEKTYTSFLAGTIQPEATGTTDNWNALGTSLSQDIGYVKSGNTFITDVNNVGLDAAEIGLQLLESSEVPSSYEEGFEGDLKTLATDCGTTLADPSASDYESESW